MSYRTQTSGFDCLFVSKRTQLDVVSWSLHNLLGSGSLWLGPMMGSLSFVDTPSARDGEALDWLPGGQESNSGSEKYTVVSVFKAISSTSTQSLKMSLRWKNVFEMHIKKIIRVLSQHAHSRWWDHKSQASSLF